MRYADMKDSNETAREKKGYNGLSEKRENRINDEDAVQRDGIVHVQPFSLRERSARGYFEVAEESDVLRRTREAS